MSPEDMAKKAVEAVKAAVSTVQSAFAKQLEELKESITKERLEDSQKLSDLVKRIDELPEPEKGDPGKDADPEFIKSQVEEAVKAAVAEIPAPKDGKDVDLESLKSFITEEVSKIPVPKDGKSITIDDVKELIINHINEKIAEIPSPKDGKDADLDELKAFILSEIENLPKAKDGKDGEDGKSVTLDEVKDHFKEYIDKKFDELPEPEDGLDALDIEILPAINENKAYPRGVYATHNGGLWKSYQNTDGMRGWDCIVNGIADVQIEHDGERGFTIKTLTSLGENVQKSFSIPAMIYKEIYKEGEEYEEGDVVTRFGSLWYCKAKTKEAPGESSTDWRLAVKKGRDAKEPVKLEPKSKTVKLGSN